MGGWGAKFVAADVASLDPNLVSEAFQDAEISLLAGCAPCQPFSTYSRGNRAGSQSDDWKLVRDFARLIKLTDPDLVTMENVPPLADQKVFDELIEALDGHFIDYGIVQCAQLGVPQTRKRLVLVASKFGRISVPAPEAKTTTVRDAIGDLPSIAAGQSNADDPMHVSSRLSEKNMLRIRASRPGGTWRDWPEDLRAACHIRSSGESYPSVYGRMSWDEPAPTMTTQCFGYGNGRFGHPVQDRAISLREAAMLQTFPRDYEFIPPGEKVSFASLGRLIGNAVPVCLGEAIARSLVSHVNAFAHVIKSRHNPTTPSPQTAVALAFAR
ncbi:MAG: DNA cytosine methyltransferase [Myxococcales bacterium]|nr:MAG: DNA cytosine methyltransferase [Myxococcales bacterium]